MKDMIEQSKESANKDSRLTAENTHVEEKPTGIYYQDILPSSSVWCTGDSFSNRVCRFRNLYYSAENERFFIIRTNSSILHNLPPSTMREKVLESGSVNNHPWTVWSFDEVSPLSPAFRNVPLRYETELHILYKRFHPLNIMHNLHDDAIVLFHHLKQVVGGGDEKLKMPFGIFNHRIQFIDPYGYTESSRPFQYLSEKPLRMWDYLNADKNVVTGFRDAVVGAEKLTTWYQYGFTEPQGPIKREENAGTEAGGSVVPWNGKPVNGLHIREFAEWFCRRLDIPLDDDEVGVIGDVPLHDAATAAGAALVEFGKSDIIVILSRRKNRLILNEQELSAALKRVYSLDVVFVRNEDHTFEEQIKLMRRARVVISMHGSILIMAMFCRRGTVIVEMYPYAVPAENYTPYKTMAQLPGMDLVYRSWTNTHPENSIPHDDWDELVGGINHLPKEQQDHIRNNHTVPTHLCCTDPFWLYRIYQDTRIDIDELLVLINDGFTESRALLQALPSSPRELVTLPPPIVQATDFTCLGGDARKPGTLWVEWKMPWTGVHVDLWVIKIEEGGFHYSSLTNSVMIPGFEPGEKVHYSVKGIIDGIEQGYGSITYCIV